MSEQAKSVYDVFISYSPADQGWVTNELLPKLEHVGIRYTEQLLFELGRPKLDEIERAIKESHRTLLVLTPNYLEDTWGQFDSILVGSYGLDTSSWKTIPVITKACDLPARLRALVAVDLHQSSEQSWQRLINALSPTQLEKSNKQISQNEYNSRTVRNGLEALSEMMIAPDIRAAMVAFRTDFQAVCEQIEILGNYKDLHDLLHTLEFQSYSGIVQEAKRFPNDDTALDILLDHQLTLQQIVADVREVTVRGNLTQNETIWIKDLEEAVTQLHGAIETLEIRQLKRTVWLINRVLAIQPSRINTSLNTAARVLRLPALVSAMNYLHSNLTDSQLSADKTQQLKNSIDALIDLNNNLTDMVKSHNDWQEMDLELRRIEANLEKDIFELEMSWTDLKAMTEFFYQDIIEEWALLLKKDTEGLDNAITEQNPAKVKRCFRSFRRRAGERFYRIDTELKRLCGNLRIVGEPLASVLRMME